MSAWDETQLVSRFLYSPCSDDDGGTETETLIGWKQHGGWVGIFHGQHRTDYFLTRASPDHILLCLDGHVLGPCRRCGGVLRPRAQYSLCEIQYSR